MTYHNRLHRQLLRQRFTLLHLQENRCLLQPAAQVHRHQAERPTQQERNTPAPVVYGLLRHAGIHNGGDHRAEQDPDRQPRG